ncbi:capsule biosynthesis GfcC family protein [Stenotrophomonas tumulicola]|uniref:Capsule biosynthesis GfcC family protein n=2 Tax=Stenotrophomonas tumulicola TaxID=1685415 RepID=A0A7W3FQG1_9GAMM|nr:capsule biosynthesis GfcC family protein [Stenotrophomonas tumulicola]
MKCMAAAMIAPLLFCASLSASAQETSAGAQVRVEVSGNVRTPGQFDIPPGGRLADALVAARPAPDAYLPGAMLLKQQAKEQQFRLRAGLAHDLALLQRSADADVQQAAGVLTQWLDDHPATGRVRQSFDMRLIQVQPQSNPVLGTGDAIVVPSRPQAVRVMGAVLAECRVQHEPLRDAKDYLRDCPASAAADRNDIYVIQPDGYVQKLGVALWNRADPQPIAPGGTLYVPLAESSAGAVDEAFNSEFAAFIATQPITP